MFHCGLNVQTIIYKLAVVPIKRKSSPEIYLKDCVLALSRHTFEEPWSEKLSSLDTQHKLQHVIRG